MPKTALFFTLLKILLIAGALIAGLLLYGFIQYSQRPAELARADFWLGFPGATVTAKGIHFDPLNRVITHQDGSAGQPNPPVNISGQHLSVTGDFTVTAIISNIDKQASLRLYSAPPVVYDQWRRETPSIDIGIDAIKKSITARIWDGSSSYSMDERTYEVFLNPSTVISLQHTKSQIIISANNRVLGSMPDHHIFDSGTIWFGAGATAGGTGWRLNSLTTTGHVKIAAPMAPATENNDKNSLRNLADNNSHKMAIGVAVALAPLLTDEQYKNAALGQFNIITPENALKPEFIHPEANVYDFEEADQLVNAARKNDIAVHGHVLVYEKSSPEWMIESPVAERQSIMIGHIKNVVGHFTGKIAEWDVVNEPFSQKQASYKNGGNGLKSNIWFEAMGEKYIDLAFGAAHQADPAVKLYLNDYGVEKDGQHWDALLALIKRLQKRGVPIDGIGFEAHMYTDGDYLDAPQLKNHMEILAGLGLLTRISEIDVTQDDGGQQVDQYVMALDVCLKAPNCTSYTTWGISDKYGSTTRSDRYPAVYGTSLLWDKDMKTKPAYTAIQARLTQ